MCYRPVGQKELDLVAGSGYTRWPPRLPEQPIFYPVTGEPFTGTRLGPLVKRYLKQASIEVVGSCHLFRHAAATHMLENGADIRFIQVLLGHEDLNSTQVYTQVSVEKLRLVVVATHPAKLEGCEHTLEACAA